MWRVNKIGACTEPCGTPNDKKTLFFLHIWYARLKIRNMEANPKKQFVSAFNHKWKL